MEDLLPTDVRLEQASYYEGPKKEKWVAFVTGPKPDTHFSPPDTTRLVSMQCRFSPVPPDTWIKELFLAAKKIYTDSNHYCVMPPLNLYAIPEEEATEYQVGVINLSLNHTGAVISTLRLATEQANLYAAEINQKIEEKEAARKAREQELIEQLKEANLF